MKKIPAIPERLKVFTIVDRHCNRQLRKIHLANNVDSSTELRIAHTSGQARTSATSKLPSCTQTTGKPSSCIADIVTSTEYAEIDRENRQALSAMTSEEILEAQEALRAQLDPKIVAFLSKK